MFRKKGEKLFIKNLKFKNSYTKKRFRLDFAIWRMQRKINIETIVKTLKNLYVFPLCIIKSGITSECFEIAFYDKEQKKGKIIISYNLDILVEYNDEKETYKYLNIDEKILLFKIELKNDERTIVCKYSQDKVYLNIQFSDGYEVRILKSFFGFDNYYFLKKLKKIKFTKEIITDSKIILKELLQIQKNNCYENETAIIKTFYKRKKFSEIIVKKGIVCVYKHSTNKEFVEETEKISLEYFLSQN